ncbi:hypothetical protein ACTXG7_02110 [Mycolicibacterium sp. Dal123E01]|uniref:hypothetical protein n=1 Tax=Mycolicibacterium sp. Dal123E01 TaxID=3457578 RepID=UPI00403E96CC
MAESISNFYASATSALTSTDGSRVLFAAGLAAGFIGVAAVLLPVNVSLKRWVFWVGWAAAAILLALSGLRRGIGDVAIVALAVMMGGALFAYYTTPFIKIRGRVWTAWISDAREDPDVPPPPPDSYEGRVTASSMWWNLAVLSVMTGGFALAHGWLVPAGLMGGALMAAPLATVGHLDRKEHFPLARGRYFPFAIVVLSLIPTLLWPVVVYFAAYYLTTPTPAGDDVTSDPYIDHDL